MLHSGLAIATAIEVDKKAPADLSAVSSARTTMTKTMATMITLMEGSAIGPANTAFFYLC